MGYLGNCRDLGQTAAEIQARLPALLDACIARYAGATVHHTISTEIVDAQAWMR
jgi:hypothetical protein